MSGRRTQRVRMVADPYPPYQYEEQGRVRGVDQEIVAQAFLRRGLEVETRLLPWKQCLAWMDSRKAEGVFQILPSPEREQLYLFSDPLRTERTTLYERKGRMGSGVSGSVALDLVQSRRLGILEGYSYGPEVDGLPQSRKLEYRSGELLLRGLVGGEVELILMDTGVAAHLMESLAIHGIQRVPGFELTRSLHAAFRRDRGDLLDLFNSGLAEVRRQGTYDRILNSYGL